MHRYTLEIDGRRFVVDVQEQGADRFGVSVDGQAFDVALTEREELGGGEALSIAPAAPSLSSPPAMPLAAAARPAPAPRAAAPAAAASTHAAPGVLGAPMPGVILRVLVAPGAQVKRGQDLAVLEAMKMENLIRAPRDATVVEVCVKAGQHVGHGQALVKLDEVGAMGATDAGAS